MNKGTIYNQVLVVDYSFQGMGVVKIDNFTIFVPFVEAGTKVDIVITDLKKNFGYGQVIEPNYPKVECPYYYSCGSCNMMHLPYGEQIGLKQKTLLNLMHKNMIYTKLEYFCSTDNRVNYRNKIAMPVHYIDGKLKLGYYKRSSHSLIPVASCLLADNNLNQLIAPIETALNEMGEYAYNYRNNRGNVRHVVLRGNADNVMVTITSAKGRLNDEQLLIECMAKYPQVTSIVINHQPAKSRVILGTSNRVIFGLETINLNLNGLDFKVKPNAFFQVNQEMTNNIFDYINQMIDCQGKNVLDAFCGTGTIGLALAKNAKSIVGIEIDHEAVESAKANALELGITNAKYICDDIEQAISSLDIKQFDLAIVDPPRSGLAANMKQALVNMQLSELVYISCDPSTLMRDIGELSVIYEIESIKGFDMFPNTNHIETVAHLKLREEL